MTSTPILINTSQTQTRTATLQDKILPALSAGLLGLMLVYAAGFAETAQIHNAAHDGRHSASFPCH